jgi:hypothetical protein
MLIHAFFSDTGLDSQDLKDKTRLGNKAGFYVLKVNV